MYEASSEERKATAPEISSGSPILYKTWFEIETFKQTKSKPFDHQVSVDFFNCTFVLPKRFAETSLDHAWSNAIDANITRCQLRSCSLSQPKQCSLGNGIGGQERHYLVCSDRGYINNGTTTPLLHVRHNFFGQHESSFNVYFKNLNEIVLTG